MSPRIVWWLNAVAIALFWAAYLAIQVPIPGVNEPHYLCKAKHFWQPGYCPGDFFLDSSDTHFVFYLTFGWLTQFFSLATVAFLGRAIAVTLLATGWTSLSRRVTSVSWAPFGSAAMFLGLTSWQNFSGEWIVGGLESKVIAYGCLFFSWSLMFDGRWKSSAVLMGTAISFHPVVAGWGLIATCLGMGFLKLRDKGSFVSPSPTEFGLAFVTTLICSLPGLIPALLTLMKPVKRMELADQLQVFRRLGHHLNPAQFSLAAYLVYGGLLVLWVCLVWWQGGFQKASEETSSRLNGAHRFWLAIVLGSVIVTCGGLVVGWANYAIADPGLTQFLTKLMKFYPFRLVDVLLPFSVALLLIDFTQVDRRPVLWRSAVVGLLSVASAATALMLVMPSRNVDGYTESKTESWIDICRWIDQHLPEDALVLAPRSSVTFRWYSSRAAYVTFKDCPQDAAGILEWNRRLNLYQEWASRSFRNDRLYDDRELAELARLTGATHLLASLMGPFEREPIHHNEYYRIYKLPDVEK
ncbi:MAG: hypothetical protein HUJ26_04005 [Planctomycetaceae bacterium]|nr:hypothetical protein [Planctomycetaceae bacterium]